MGHKLAISVEDSVYDNRYIFVNDLSVWDDILPIEFRRLQILPPFLDKYVIVPFPSNQTLAVNTVNLTLTRQPSDLHDGFYNIHYSVAPNSSVFVEYGHYRIATALNKVLRKMATLDLDFDNLIDNCGNVELTKGQNTLLHIWMMLKGAQATGCLPHGKEKADVLYKQAIRQYAKLFDENCTNC